MVNQKRVEPNVARLIQQAACRLLAVASGAPCFLIIAFQILGHVVMNDKGHVGFVDSHAKRIGRNDDRRTVADEILLRSAAHLIAHARMIAYRIHAAILKHPRHFLDALARAAIHDAALSLVFLQKTPQLCVTVLRAANLQRDSDGQSR